MQILVLTYKIISISSCLIQSCPATTGYPSSRRNDKKGRLGQHPAGLDVPHLSGGSIMNYDRYVIMV